jgi:hypothetical protein
VDFTRPELANSLRKYGGNQQNIELLSVLWVSLLDDTPVTCSCKPDSTIREFAKRLADDAVGLIKHYASLYDDLTRSVFLSAAGQITIDHFIESFRDTPIFFEYIRFYKTHDPVLFQYISTFLLFGKKSYYEDPTFDTTAFRGWLEVEDRLGNLVLSPEITSDLREIIAWFMRDFDDDLFLPKHGNGAVCEPKVRGFSAKNKLLGLDDQQRTAFDRSDQFELPMLQSLPSSDVAIRKVSRLKFVPKDIGKSRSICMEPANLQFLQQGVRLWIEQALAATIGRHIPLHDQKRNCDLAAFGSKTGRVDTIDLSQASDSVSMELIRAIFPENVLQYLEATRSATVITPETEERSILKFAPMGSALCFPIQSIVYAAVTLRSSLAWLFGKTASESLGLNRRSLYHYYSVVYDDHGKYRLNSFSIYGDDIICDSRVTNIAVETLQLLGFAVNESKSFTGDSAFRESCGGYYLHGEDVTPLRAKFKKIGVTMPPSTLPGFIDLANRAYALGYRNLRRHAIRICLHYPIADRSPQRRPANGSKDLNQILFTSNEDAALAILTSHPRNTHLSERKYATAKFSSTASKWQRDEIRSLSFGPEKAVESSSGDDDYLHVVWWRSRLNSLTDQEVSKKIPATAGLRWRWTDHLGY